MVSSRFCRRSSTFCTVLFLWDSGSAERQGGGFEGTNGSCAPLTAAVTPSSRCAAGRGQGRAGTGLDRHHHKTPPLRVLQLGLGCLVQKG